MNQVSEFINKPLEIIQQINLNKSFINNIQKIKDGCYSFSFGKFKLKIQRDGKLLIMIINVNGDSVRFTSEDSELCANKEDFESLLYGVTEIFKAATVQPITVS
jgi:hypothetical protein